MEEPSPLVSIVVPTRNRAAMLLDCVGSLRRQDYAKDRYEIIVVDDGSSDGTGEVAQNLGASPDPPPVKLLRQPHRGPNAARNAGLSAASGDPICLVDDDVEAPPGWLRALVSGALRHPEAGCVGGPIRLRLEGKAPRICGREPLGESELDLGPRDLEAQAVWSANMAVRRWALDRAGLFLETLPIYADEVEWEQRLRAAGGKIVYVADAWLWHRRTQQDLRLARLLRNRFRRGANQVEYFLAIGQPLSLRAEAAHIPGLIGHAVRSRCVWGLLAATVQAGRVSALVRARFARRGS